MTKLLEVALDRVRALPENAQDEIAQIILDEMESERRWQEQFARDSEKLKALSDRAMAEYLAGETEPLDPDKL